MAAKIAAATQSTSGLQRECRADGVGNLALRHQLPTRNSSSAIRQYTGFPLPPPPHRPRTVG